MHSALDIFSLPGQSNFHQSHKFCLRLITLDSSPQSIPNPLLSVSEYFLLMLLTHLLMQLNILLHAHKAFILHFVLHPVIHQFLGGLSLHLNHLIAQRMSAPYWQFGTLPIGIFLSNLDSRQLETSLMTYYSHFDICQLLATPGPFEYFGQNWVSSENQSFLDEGATGLQSNLGVLAGQMTRLHDGTIFGGM